MTSYDLIVVGSGPAASHAIQAFAKEGKRVAVIEEREFGGTCALRGCNPKKVLVHAAELADQARRSKGRLIEFEDLRIEWPALREFMKSFVSKVPASTEKSWGELGVDLHRGRARFVSPNELEAGGTVLSAPRILLATGARPRPLDIPGEELVTTSDEFLEMETFPERVVFIGGGYVTFEYAHLAARIGSEVHIAHRDARPLTGFDPHLVERLVEHSRSIGIDVHLETEVVGIERRDDGSLEVMVEDAEGRRGIPCDRAIHGAGRVPNLEGLDLEAGRVESSRKGVVVDRHLRSTTNHAVHAAGDCAATIAPLSPVAGFEGKIVARNLLAREEEEQQAVDAGAVPSVVFSVPSLASVGLTEERAREEGRSFEIREGDLSEWNSVRKLSQPCAAYRILVDDEDLVLGAHLLGPNAAETINVFAVAMNARLTTRGLQSVLMAFPTFGSDVRSML